ncbi:MAG: 6-phosphogluconolactonase [Calditrichia bacterium]
MSAKNESILMFAEKHGIAEYAAQKLLILSLNATTENPAFVALSGGSTPKALFRLLAETPYRNSVLWENIILFWGDERCVPPDSVQSNFGTARELLFDRLDNAPIFHRVRGEADPLEANKAYADLLCKTLPLNDSELPVFDWIMLGMGEDGHTASIFPQQPLQHVCRAACGIATHPDSGQKRVSFTMDVLNAAKEVSFLVAGAGKANVVEAIFTQDETPFPADQVHPSNGKLEWCLDRAAGDVLLKLSNRTD